MESTEATHSLKPNLSQLLMRTIEQLEDPKYATVPQTHWDELRPSILAKYHCDGGQDRDFLSGHILSNDNVCQQCLPPTINANSSQKVALKPITFRAMTWKVHPIWRYCASKIQLQIENSSRQVVSAVKAKRNAYKKESIETSTTVTPTSYDIEEQKTKWRSQSFDQLISIGKQQHGKKLRVQGSVPAFELMPPLFENCTHSLLYQNSYLLDGVKYDYDSTKPQQQQHCVSAKLRLNYMKFLKSINRTQKPTDRDIVFGEAKVVMNPPPRWESSRIDWLLNLERKQEMRKLQFEAQQQQFSDKHKTNVLSKKEAKDVNSEIHPKVIEKGKRKTEHSVKPRPNQNNGKKKNFFLSKSKKFLKCKKT